MFCSLRDFLEEKRDWTMDFPFSTMSLLNFLKGISFGTSFPIRTLQDVFSSNYYMMQLFL